LDDLLEEGCRSMRYSRSVKEAVARNRKLFVMKTTLYSQSMQILKMREKSHLRRLEGGAGVTTTDTTASKRQLFKRRQAAIF
jgi:hypothetical protein